jgi:hypothetical protein
MYDDLNAIRQHVRRCTASLLEDKVINAPSGILVIACLWEIVVNDHLHPLKVHSTGHQIRAYQHPDIAKAKPPVY